MSFTKPVIAFGYPPTLHKPSHRPFAIIKQQNPFSCKRSFRCLDYIGRVKKNHKSKRSFVPCNVVLPEVPPPSGPSFNVTNWVVGVVLSIFLPFCRHNYGLNSIVKLKNEVETVVETADVIAHVVEKVAEDVEKVAEHIAADLPNGGTLRQAVDFVGNMAEMTSRDAHLVGDFIDKVRVVEEKVEACAETLAEEVMVHEHAKEEDKAF